MQRPSHRSVYGERDQDHCAKSLRHGQYPCFSDGRLRPPRLVQMLAAEVLSLSTKGIGVELFRTVSPIESDVLEKQRRDRAGIYLPPPA